MAKRGGKPGLCEKKGRGEERDNRGKLRSLRALQRQETEKQKDELFTLKKGLFVSVFF